jgi:hypothetical protein
MFLKQSTASQTRLVGPFVDSTDFSTAETGLTIANTDVKLSKNGAASANKNSGGGTHIVNGHYSLTFDATDTATVGELAGSIVVAGALQVAFKFFVVEEAIYDELFAASALGYIANAPVSVAQWTGTNVATVDTAGYPKVTIKSGTGTGEVSLTSGIAAVNPTQINGSANAAARLALSAAQIIPFTVDTAGFSPTNTAFETSSITEATADHYKDRIVIWTTGALAGQQQGVTVYALNTGRGRFTLTAGTEAAANGDTGILV